MSRRRGLTGEERAERRGVGMGFEFAFNIVLLILADFGLSEDEIYRVYVSMKNKAQMSVEGRLTMKDVKNTLQDEYGYSFSWLEDVKGIKPIEAPKKERLKVEVPVQPDFTQLLTKFNSV